MQESSEEVKVPPEMTTELKEAKDFINNLSKDSFNFLKLFLGDMRVCFRCVLMLFNERSVS